MNTEILTHTRANQTRTRTRFSPLPAYSQDRFVFPGPFLFQRIPSPASSLTMLDWTWSMLPIQQLSESIRPCFRSTQHPSCVWT